VATASQDGQPHVVPVVYEFDGAEFYFTGWNLERSLKFRNLAENNKVALVVDDLLTVCPWRPRGLEVRGTAELAKEGDRPYVRVTPMVKRSWGFR
jgi:pyridoxamine 5'-phosphate oxidase family protein